MRTNFMLVFTNMKVKRRYEMGARATSAAATKQAILDAAETLLSERLRADIRLGDVATLAGVSEMTVLRAFGSKDTLLQAALDQARQRIVDQRQHAPPGDVEGSIEALFDHYERLGDLVVRNLAEEASDPSVRMIVRVGRADHRRWVRRQFAPQLASRPGDEREELVDSLVAACDVYVWKLLRRDLRRSKPRAIACVTRTVKGLLYADTADAL
jgi:AcrR family transcriptional regulator